MKLSKDEVKNVAKLARLKISEEETEKFSIQLSSILDYVQQLQEVNTDGVIETSQVTGLENKMRQDVVEGCDLKTREKILNNAPELEENLIKTRRVFE